jgi:hypothetical protein
MQALTLAVSPSGIQYFAQQLLVSQMQKALSSLAPPTTTINPPNVDLGTTSLGSTIVAENIAITLSNGSLTNFNPQLDSITQGVNGQFTIVLVASGLTVNYQWNEQYETYWVLDVWGDQSDKGHTNNTWPYSMGIDTFTITIPITLSQQTGSYTITVGQVTLTPSGFNPQIPPHSIVEYTYSCFTKTIDNTTQAGLENLNFRPQIQNLLQGLFGTIPASGQLTPNIVFNYNEGDTPLVFPNDQAISLGVTGNVTWEGNAYSGNNPPSLGIPSVPSNNHVHFYAADYEFNELYWAFFKDGRLNTTITAGQLPDPQMLNTSYYQSGPLSPLYQKYPNCNMTIGATPLSAPTVTFQAVYQLSYGDNGVLTTQEASLPTNIYQQLETLQGSIYLSQSDYTTALQTALGPDGTQYIPQIQLASVVSGPFTQVYQVTATGMSSLQSRLPSGIYGQLSASLTAGQVFADKSWLLVAVENALGTLAFANQYAPQIEMAFAISKTYDQVYWVTYGTNGALTTLVDQIPADIYNDLVGLANIVYVDQPSFLTALENAIGQQVGQYSTQISTAALVNGAIATQNVQAVFNVIKSGQTIPVFTVNIQETDFQQNFRLSTAGYAQTVQFDFQLIDNETSAALVSSKIPGIDSSTFPTIWNFVLQPVYALEMQKMAHTGVPLPFMTGLQFLFNQATVTVQQGYADVLANVQYIAPAEFTDALAHNRTDEVRSLLEQCTYLAGAPATPEPIRIGGGTPTLHRTRSAAKKTQVVRRGSAVRSPTRNSRALRGGHQERPAETFDFHFALGHLPGVDQFYLHTGYERIALKPHTPETLAEHAKRNRALGLLDDDMRGTFTHYVESIELSPRRARILRVTYPSARASIPELALMAVHVPLWARTAHRQRRLQRDHRGVPPNLAHLGVTTRLPYAQALAAANDADHLITTISTAATIVFHHPQLATSDPVTAAAVIDDHINSSDNLTNIQRFQGQIARQGKDWQASVPSVDIQGNQLLWGPGFARSRQPVYNNQLSEATIAGAGGAMQLPLITSQQDPALQNSSWSVNQGTGTVYHIAPQAARQLRAGRARSKAAIAAVNGGYAFTLNNLTPGQGLSIEDSSMTFEPDEQNPGAGTLTISVSNSYLRSLYAYAQFLNDHGKIIQVTQDGQQSNYLAINVVTPINVALGIPLPTEPTVLSFDWIAGAASARLVHGGLGIGRWDNDVVWPGAILTGIFNYAIPGLFLLVGAELESNAWFKTLEEEKPLVATLLQLGLGVFGTEESASVAFPDVSAFLSAMADAIAGFLVHSGLEELQAYIIEKLGESAFEDAIPGVDIFFQIANRAVDLVEIAETTVEVLSSPAVYEVDIVRTLDLQATISPDPTHGTSTNPAVWPNIAATWEAIVQYRGGTSHSQSGSMLGTSSQPITVTFNALPAGGSLQVKFNVYSSTGFLCGQFTGAWQQAVLPNGQQTLAITGSIQENSVPLTAGTVYQYQKKLVYNTAASAHMWQPSQFMLDLSQTTALNERCISRTISQVFQQNGCTLDKASVEVLDPGQAWTITDGPTVYRIALQQIMAGNSMTTVLMVNTANAPLQVVTDLSANDTANNLAKLVNVTMNEKAYMLGYCWRASGQNIPETGGDFPISSQIHAFQNINVLSNPEASLKFSPSGFVNQPAIVYDQFGPAPLFSVDASFSNELDGGGAVGSDLAAVFSAYAYPLPSNAVVAVITAGAAWTISVPNAAPTYSLARVTDVIEVHSYPTDAISQRNYYVQPTSVSPTYQYQLRKITLDNATPFDMNQSESWGLFTLPFNDDFVVHPQGYVIAISYTLSRMMILQLPDAPAPDDKVISAVIVSGPAGNQARQGLMNGPTALSVTADGRILVLEQGTQQVAGRIQSFDINGNPVPSFDGAAIMTVPTSHIQALNAGQVSVDLRQAFASAGTLLSGVWLIRDGTTVYQLTEDNGTIVVTSGGANLSLNWMITSGGNTYHLTLDGATISVAQGEKVLFTMPATLAVNLNRGITTGDVAEAFSQNNISLANPVSISGDELTLDPSVAVDLAEGAIPASLTSALAARGLSLSSNAQVTATVEVTVRTPGSLWTLQDLRTDSSYKITLDTTNNGLGVINLVSTVPLCDRLPSPGVTYLSLNTELKGYIYVLSHTGDGSSVTDYRLDIYHPNGPWLARTDGVNAAKIVVDMWRTLYTLNYEAFPGPGGRTEPSVSIWAPSS